MTTKAANSDAMKPTGSKISSLDSIDAGKDSINKDSVEVQSASGRLAASGGRLAASGGSAGASLSEKSVSLINHPPYYTIGGIEAIEVIEAWELGFCLGEVVKYICRRGRKGLRYRKTIEIQDLKRAQWYLARRIEQLEKEDLS